MKKLILTTLGIAGASMVAYSQGTVSLDDLNTPGYVVQSSFGPNSSTVTASYIASPNFTIALYALNGNQTLSALTAQPDANGYLSVAQFTTDFTAGNSSLVGTTPGGSGNGVSAGDGYFNGGKFTLLATAGGFDTGTSTYTASDVIALVGWTGTWSTLASALANNASVGIFAFVNNIGPGGTSPAVPELTGWPTGVSAASAANEAPGYPELILSPVPEPATIALASLGGLSLLAFRRRKA